MGPREGPKTAPRGAHEPPPPVKGKGSDPDCSGALFGPLLGPSWGPGDGGDVVDEDVDVDVDDDENDQASGPAHLQAS